MKYFKDKNTNEVYAYDQEQIDGGWVKEGLVAMTEEEVSAHLAQPKVDPLIAIAARRYEAEVGGVVLNGVRINTDDRSKLLINGAALEATFDPAYTMQWKTSAGFVELTGAQVIGIARAVRAHVQACFDREAELLAALEAGALTDEMLGQGWPAP